MSAPALRHFVERALGLYEPSFGSWFPACFDWQRLCADTPAMTTSASGGVFDGSDAALAGPVRDHAERTLRFCYLAALAILSAREADDPEARLAALTSPLDDEEEERFQALTGEVLGPVEEVVGGTDAQLDERGEEAVALFESVWPTLEELLAEAGALEVGADEQAVPTEALPVLAGLARVATILAVLRRMALVPEAA